MGVVEDVRQAPQDLVAPDLRAIEARISALESAVRNNERRTEKQMDELKTLVEKQNSELKAQIEKQHNELLGAIRRVEDIHSLSVRLAALEAERKPAA